MVFSVDKIQRKLKVMKSICVRRSKYGASMKMYGSEGLDVIEDGWIGQGIKKREGGYFVPL